MNLKPTFKSNKNITYSCKYHVVFCPKYRRPVLVGGVDARLKEIIAEVFASTASGLIELEVMPDHVHILAEVDPQFGIHTLVKRVKGKSSFLLRSEFPWLRSRIPSLWTNSYFISTVGRAPLSVIKQYIEAQKTV
jgi:putative transposase